MAGAPNPLIVIPARLASRRLPDKPLARIGDAPMIVQVWRRAIEADRGPVLVACAEPAIADAVRAAGGDAVLTDPAHPSGSDRIHEAVGRIDPDRRHDVIVNLQGDIPSLDPALIGTVLALLDDPATDIGTLAAEIVDRHERDDPACVKPIVAWTGAAAEGGDRRGWRGQRGRALYFTRATAPSGAGPLFHHIGIYAYRRAALDRFVALPPSPLEIRESLEQLRALEAGMRIDVARVDTVPLGVDTPADLERARRLFAGARNSQT